VLRLPLRQCAQLLDDVIEITALHFFQHVRKVLRNRVVLDPLLEFVVCSMKDAQPLVVGTL
jgi:hypothetical protein